MQMTNQYVRTPVVRYSSRMRVGRIHPMKVSLATNGVPSLGFQSANSNFDPPVVIQVTVPGAVVTPPHVIVPLAGGDANFYVQPLMPGRLVGGKVEFLSQGRKIGEVALPMKANRGRLAKWLFFFALVIPFVINFFPELSYTEKVQPQPAQPAPEEKKPKQLPASTNRPDQLASVHDDVLVLPVVFTQPPKNEKKEGKAEKKDSSESKSSKSESKPTKPDETTGSEQKKVDQKGTPRDNPPSGPEEAANVAPQASPVTSEATIPYKGEEAISAWVRSQLTKVGYKTKPIPPGKSEVDASEPLAYFVHLPRRYEITNEPAGEWSTPRVLATGLYYAEPGFRFLYRTFIAFPRTWPLGDLIYCAGFLTLAVLVWLMTNPNRRTLKGPVMNIHVGS